ncbi:MAG TPA: hypothetical protein VGF97_14825 [Rhizomicrobium sp.]|jgi:hypothetical protein
MLFRPLFATVLLVAIVVGTSEPAQAYMGPGAGLSAIGSALSLVSTVFLAIIGFVWYPIKRFFASDKDEQPGHPPTSQVNRVED